MSCRTRRCAPKCCGPSWTRWRARRRGRWLTSAAVGLAAALLAVGLVVVIRPETIGLHTSTTEQASAQMLDMTKVVEHPDQCQRRDDRLRLGHPHRHGLLLRRLGPPRMTTTADPGHGGGRPRRQPIQIATWLGAVGRDRPAQRDHADALGRHRCRANGFVPRRQGAAREETVIGLASEPNPDGVRVIR